MSDINYAILEGRLVKNPDLRQTPSGVSVCDVHIANNRYIPCAGESEDSEPNFRQHTTFAKVTLWNEKADKWADILRKGDRILVVGKLVDDNYEIKAPSEENGNGSRMTRGRLKLDSVERITVISSGYKRETQQNKERFLSDPSN